MNHAVDHSPNGASGHEQSEANLKLIVYSAVGLAVAVAIVLLLMWGVFNFLKNDAQAKGQTLNPLATPVQIPPEPRLEPKPWESMQALRAHEEHVLSGYGWQDQKAGVVRIPIDRAMDIIAQRGFPAPPPQPAGTKPATKKPSAGAANVAQ